MREQLITAFLNQHGWGEADRTPLAADASFRTYERLNDDGAKAMLMDAPPPQEDVRPFVRIADHLSGLGFSVPVVRAKDEEAGLLILDDLGDDTYTRLLAAGEDEGDLYRLAVDVLIHLHRHPVHDAVPEGTPLYSEAKFLEEASLLPDWFMTPKPSADNKAEYDNLWRALHPAACDMPATLVLRDFHVDNLMRLDREGMRACGMLDFQDALRGPVTYDLMSLLEDARRDISADMVAELTTKYLDAFPDLDRDVFETSWAIWAAQRHAKVIGIFTRLCVRDGKSVYLDHIPRVWRLLDRALRHPALAGVRDWMDRHIPQENRRRPPL